MTAATLILPHQLFKKHPAISKDRLVILAELEYFFTRYSFHKHKLILHQASMLSYADDLKKRGYAVSYVSYEEIPTLTKLVLFLKKQKISALHYAEIIEQQLESELHKAAKQHNITLKEYTSEYFLSDRALLKSFFKPAKKQYLMAAFYRQQRKALGILMDAHGKPIGGSWSFDELNRHALPQTITVPKLVTPRATKHVIKIKKKIEAQFSKNPGEASTFWYPTTHAQAKRWLTHFLKTRLTHFGPYQDAIDKEYLVLFHSALTPLLNIGLLTPQQVVNATLSYAQKHKISLNSLEGFLRQIIGWREYMYGMYLFHGTKMRTSNYFKHTRRLPDSFWHGSTGIEPVDTTIKRAIVYSYAHHIERLMVMGNFMLLCQYHPSSVFDWFMELFIDAYDWVMVPNVYGMSQYADGGQLATKPYMSSSNYILKMSNYAKGPWCAIWDSLFWYFIHKHIKTFTSNPRCAFMVSAYKRMNERKRQEHIVCAQRFLNELHQ